MKIIQKIILIQFDILKTQISLISLYSMASYFKAAARLVAVTLFATETSGNILVAPAIGKISINDTNAVKGGSN